MRVNKGTHTPPKYTLSVEMDSYLRLFYSLLRNVFVFQFKMKHPRVKDGQNLCVCTF